jgi:hypothetical protein
MNVIWTAIATAPSNAGDKLKRQLRASRSGFTITNWSSEIAAVLKQGETVDLGCRVVVLDYAPPNGEFGLVDYGSARGVCFLLVTSMRILLFCSQGYCGIALSELRTPSRVRRGRLVIPGSSGDQLRVTFSSWIITPGRTKRLRDCLALRLQGGVT